MNTIDIFFLGLMGAKKEGYPYRFQIHCRISEQMVIPNGIRAVYKQNKSDGIMFILDSTHKFGDISYDYENMVLSFDASFNGIPSRVLIPIVDIVAAVDDDGSIVKFGTLSDEDNSADNEPPKKPEKKPETKKRGHLRVIK